MMTTLERVRTLMADLRYAPVDFDNLYRGHNNLTPLESLELFLLEEQRLRVEKQNRSRRRKANLPVEKTLASFDFGFQRSVSKEQMLRLSDRPGWSRHSTSAFWDRPASGRPTWQSLLPFGDWIWDIASYLKRSQT